ncbi:MAG: ATP-dependent Clp protease adaptor ClpS [Phycisphaeraceae bacterium]|nr:ATP-dependent Clp protease adaptor ClpS [Phycisphaeraceae bacterium]MCW5768493.1 ATP-dependent Clp protease adaptor ClpS [Phycisphaeraceae bacterium]
MSDHAAEPTPASLPAPQAQAAVQERPATAPPRLDHLPPYRVLLHNDDVNTVEDVVFSVTEIARLTVQQAVQVTMTAHKRGIALVCVTHKERAELLEEQFRSRRLKVTIEPAPA